MNYKTLLSGMLLLTSLCFIGCGSGHVTVSGTVTFSDNGEPVKSGSVIFTGDKVMGRGTIKDGRYSVGLIRDGDGLPPGTYTVSANRRWSPMVDAETVDMHGNHIKSDSTQEEFYYTKEPITIEVTKPMTFDFTVERDGRPNEQR